MPGLRVPVLALGLAILLAGCVAPPAPGPAPAQAPAGLEQLSQARFAILPAEEVWVASSVDGKRLHHAVFRPDTREPVPVWVNFSPYWADGALDGGDNFARHMVQEYVPRGYAVVLSAVRGTGHSEGCFQISGDLEVQDAWDVVEHFHKEPWSNGRVGAGGKSYDSTTQNGLVAKLPHPALKTMFHVSGITDWYRYNYRAGLPYPQGPGFNTAYFAAEGLSEYGLDLFGGVRPDTGEDPESLARLADDLACPELAEMTASGLASGATGMKDAYYVERDWNRFIAGSPTETSVFFVHGLQDWNVKPDHVLPWLGLLPEGMEAKGWLHQWTREPEGGHVYPMRDDWNLTMLRWMDHWLKGVDTGILAEPRFEAQGSDGVWRASQAWPPAEAVVREVPLEVAPVDRGLAPWQVLEGVLLDASSQPMRVAGQATITFAATPSHADPAFTAVLWQEAPDGERTWVNEAVLRGLYRDGLDAPAPLVPGQEAAFTMEFYPMDAVLEPGHRWVVGLHAQPRFVFAHPLMAGIAYDPGSVVVALPLAPVDAALPVQPVPVDCFAC